MTDPLILELTATQPAIFSRAAATEGVHRTLDAPTGAALLGWAAARCYTDMEAALHAGQLRFSNAVRMAGEMGCFANPAILLEPKHGGGAACIGRAAFITKYGNNVQAEAVSGKLVTAAALEGTPAPHRQARLRTAIKDGVAEDARLFSYQAVMPGDAKFRAVIECSDKGLRAKLSKLFNGATLRLGRGGTTGYGGAYACRVQDAGDPWPALPEAATERRARFWLLSDACLVNAAGAPRLSAQASDFLDNGDGWQLVPSESASTVRRIWPWNRTYGSRDAEMAVIEAGSVFTFDWTGEGQPNARLASRIGIARERGFGRFALLSDSGTYTAATGSDMRSFRKVPKAAPAGIAAWAQRRAERHPTMADPEWVDDQSLRLADIIERIGRDGPGSSQWRRLRHLVEQSDENFAHQLGELLNGADWQAGHGELADLVRNLVEHKNQQAKLRVIDRAAKAAQGPKQ